LYSHTNAPGDIHTVIIRLAMSQCYIWAAEADRLTRACCTLAQRETVCTGKSPGHKAGNDLSNGSKRIFLAFEAAGY